MVRLRNRGSSLQQKDYDRKLVIDKRTKRVAQKITEFLKETGDRFQKTIVFCSILITPHECDKR